MTPIDQLIVLGILVSLGVIAGEFVYRRRRRRRLYPHAPTAAEKTR